MSASVVLVDALGTLVRMEPPGPRLRVELANALHPAFLASAVVCGVVLVVSILWIREVPLRRGFEDVAVGDEASPQPATGAAARAK